MVLDMNDMVDPGVDENGDVSKELAPLKPELINAQFGEAKQSRQAHSRPFINLTNFSHVSSKITFKCGKQ